MKPLITPSLHEFLHLAKQGNVIPVFAEFVGDCETPVSTFKKFSRSAYSFLFESTEKNDVSGRFSFVGFEPRLIIQSHGREIRIERDGIEERFSTTTDPLDELRKLMARLQFVSRPELPRFAGGAVGFLGYDAIRFFEPKVPTAREDDLQLPEILFMLTGNVLIFDHRLRSLKIVVNAFLDHGPQEKVYARAVESVDSIMQQLTEPIDLALVPITEKEQQPPPRSNLRSKESRSIFIAAFVLSIPRRTCFVLRSATIFRSLAVHPRCTSVSLATSSRSDRLPGRERAAQRPPKMKPTPLSCSLTRRNAPNTSCLWILHEMMSGESQSSAPFG